ncbi:MAG: YbdK family carboxylate-amine ligase [Coxiellaceae bacterium]|nr:YbdK family carboxylate-amine ligase [Coxiellaceae bacterium]
MEQLDFIPSKDLTIGTEIELQLLDPLTNDLTPKSGVFLAEINKSSYYGEIKPEVTHSMLEIASTIHENTDSLNSELRLINSFLSKEAEKFGIQISGGGTHSFHAWKERIVSENYTSLYEKYDFLVKKFTVFGQHIHIGCADPDKAIYLIHAFSRYLPHLIALSASSPFYDGAATAFHSTRLHLIDAFPLSGHFPYVTSWDAFCTHIDKLQKLNIIEQLRNFYWDIRLRPEFGTLEIRICDTPLTIKQAVAITAYCQTLALYFLEEAPVKMTGDLYLTYAHNRFQASRYGLKGEISVPNKANAITIERDILETLEKLAPYATYLGNTAYLDYIKNNVSALNNDAEKINKTFKKLKNMADLAKYQSNLWMREEMIH